MRIIDADELKKMFPDKGEGAWTYNITAKAYIDAQPTVDQWHYPSKGEYPTEKKLLLIKIPGCYFIGWYENNNWFMDDGEMTVLKCTVSRWQYIIPPKEEA